MPYEFFWRCDSSDLLAEELDRVRLDADLVDNVDVVKVFVHLAETQRIHGTLARHLQIRECCVAVLEMAVLHLRQMVCVEHVLREHAVCIFLALS